MNIRAFTKIGYIISMVSISLIFSNESFSQSNIQILNYNQLQNPSGTNIILLNDAPQLLEYKISNAKVLFKLDLLSQNATYPFQGDDFNYSISLLCENIAGEALNVSLEVNNNQPEAIYVVDIASFSQDDLTFLLKQTMGSFVCNSSTCSVSTNDIRLSIEYIVEFGINVKKQTHEYPILSITDVDINGKRVKITWDNIPDHLEFPNYQLQILHLYNISQAHVSTPEEIATFFDESDWNNALNIFTESSAPEYELNLAEGEGFYVCRVRPIGSFYDGGSSNNLNWSNDQWSYVEYPLTTKLYKVNEISYPFFYYSADPDKYLNYIYSRIFTEGNKNVSEQITYANGLNQVLQTQKYLPSSNKNIIVQNIYDYSGRPSMTTLGVPFEGKIIGYKTSFVTTSGGEIYSAKDFDENGNLLNPLKVSETSNFKYYSSQNLTEDQIPSAEGYPFSRTILSSDGTGRVSELANPGYHTNLHDANGDFTSRKTIRTFYCKPTEQELIRVLGAEAPKAESVKKTIVIDPNNIVSISYIGENGKILATCLSNNNLPIQSDQLDPIEENPAALQISDVIKANLSIDKGYISTHHIFIDQENSELKVAYRYNCDLVTLNCGSTEIDCGFYLTIKVFDVNANHFVLEKTFEDKIRCGDEITLEPLYNLPIGEYIITKKLIYDPESVSSVYMVNAENSVNPILNWIYDKLLIVKSDVSQKDFYRAVLSLGSEIANCRPTVNPPVPICPTCTTLMGLGVNCNLKLSPSHSVRLLNEAGTAVTAQYIDNMDSESEVLLIEVITDCCNPLYIPCIFEGKYRCESNNPPDFEGYLLDLTGGILEQYLPGYSTNGDFNTLIQRMLNDPYDISDGTGTHVQYNCDELWSAWVMVVSAYSKFNDINSQPISAESIDAENDNNTAVFNDHFDNNTHFRGLLGWALKWILKKKLNEVARDQSSSSNPTYHNVNLADEFFKLVGIRFAKPFIYNLNTGSYEFNYLPPNDYTHNRPYTTGAFGNSSFHPHILDKTYAYKYYEYNITSNFSAEILNCFRANIDQSLYCQEVPNCDGYGYENWDQQHIKSFFDYLMSYKIPTSTVLETNTCDDFNNNNFLKQLICVKTKLDCDGNCDSKYNEYKKYIEDVFRQNCYVIDGCETNVNSISSVAIDKLVQYAVNKCKEFYCPQLTISDINCDEGKCIDIYTNTINTSFARLTIPECKQLAMQVSEWFLEIGVKSMCDENFGNKICDQGDTEITIEKYCVRPTGDIEDIKKTVLRNITVTVTNGVVTIQ